jgi:hypothetical protein
LKVLKYRRTNLFLWKLKKNDFDLRIISNVYIE